MNRETLKALKGSIKKWEGIVAGEVADNGNENCPLCKLFFDNWCHRCPVAKDAGEIRCSSTPYTDWSLSVRHRGTFFVPDYAEDDESVMCAVLELEYLKSLLPSRSKK